MTTNFGSTKESFCSSDIDSVLSRSSKLKQFIVIIVEQNRLIIKFSHLVFLCRCNPYRSTTTIAAGAGLPCHTNIVIKLLFEDQIMWKLSYIYLFEHIRIN